MSVFHDAIALILSRDSELMMICQRSFSLALSSTALAVLIGFPLGILLGMKSFPGKGFILLIVNGLMALPTVVIGLMVYTLLSRTGPLGGLSLLFTPTAVIIGQVFLILPIIISMINSAVSGLSLRLGETLQTLGVAPFRRGFIIVMELRFLLLTSVLSAFGRVLGEVGISMMLGGNIKGYTRTITTTISLQSSMGEFELGMALGLVLMTIAFLIIGLSHMVVSYER